MDMRLLRSSQWQKVKNLDFVFWVLLEIGNWKFCLYFLGVNNKKGGEKPPFNLAFRRTFKQNIYQRKNNYYKNPYFYRDDGYLWRLN